MPDQIEDLSLEQVPDDPEELVAEYRRAQGEINAIIDKQSEIRQAAGGRLVETVDSEGISSWMPRVEQQHLPLTDAEEIAMKALNKLEWELEEKRDYRSLIETKAAIRGCQLPDRRQLVLQVRESRETDEKKDRVKRAVREDVAFRRGIVRAAAEANPSTRGKNLDEWTCLELDGHGVDVLEKWREYGVKTWQEAYRKKELKGRIQKMFSEDRKQGSTRKKRK